MAITPIPSINDGDDGTDDFPQAVKARVDALGLVAAPGVLAADSLNYGTVGSDVTNLTVTWTAITGVRYRTKASIPWLQKDGAGTAQVELRILDGGGTVLARRPFEVGANEDFGMELEHLDDVTLNGSRTRKAFIITSAGDVDIFGATTKATLTVEAIGEI